MILYTLIIPVIVLLQGVGKRHGGGKGPIDHYVTPVKAGRILFEVGGKCVYEEVSYLSLNHIDVSFRNACKGDLF